MREIKFRCWDKQRGKMFFDAQDHYDPTGPDHPGSGSDECFGDLTLNETVILMQYTGLKDKNSVEIYEGDILQHYAFPRGEVFKVVWDEKNGEWSGHGGFSEWNDSEVIGSIYENPGLMKGGGKKMSNSEKISNLVKKHFPATGGDGVRVKIVSILSEMFDHPDDCGIYKTGEAYDLLESLVVDLDKANTREAEGRE